MTQQPRTLAAILIAATLATAAATAWANRPMHATVTTGGSDDGIRSADEALRRWSGER